MKKVEKLEKKHMQYTGALAPNPMPTAVVSLVLLTLFGQAFVTATLHEPGHTYKHDGITCLLCPPGTYLLSHCKKNFNASDCLPCKPGTFQEGYTQATSCGQCKTYCQGDVNEIEVDQCTPTHDLKCQCKARYFWKVYDGEGRCQPYMQCRPGEIVTEKGSPYKDQQCGLPCPNGTCFELGSCVHCTKNTKTWDRTSPATTETVCKNNDVCDSGGQGMTSLIIGVSIGVAALILVIIMIFVIVRYLKKRQHEEKSIDIENPSSSEHRGKMTSSIEMSVPSQGNLLSIATRNGHERICKPAGVHRDLAKKEEVKTLLGESRNLS